MSNIVLNISIFMYSGINSADDEDIKSPKYTKIICSITLDLLSKAFYLST